MMTKSAPSWIAACPGVSVPGARAAYSAASGERLRGSREMSGMRGAESRDLRITQPIQDDQGRSVFGHLIEDTNVPAPATTHVGVTLKGGVSGPYPWRRPA
ncbi:hypothetical protein ACN3XK_48905 [Actinomadura welshii]